MRKHTGMFIAHNDSGRKYTIHIYTTYDTARSNTDPHEMTEGLQELRSGKDLVIWKGKGVYELNGRILRSDDPDAP
jgi:hypothetical protein